MEIYQNCPIYNDDAFEAIKDNDAKEEALIPLTHGEAIRFGKPGEDGLGGKGLVRSPSGGVEAVRVADIGADRSSSMTPRTPTVPGVRDLASV